MLSAALLLSVSQTVSMPLPPVDTWQKVSETNVEVLVDDLRKVFLGVQVLYQNPNNDHEFAMVIKKHVALLSTRDMVFNQELFEAVDVSQYQKKREEDTIKSARSQADVIGCMHWFVKVDPKSHQQIINYLDAVLLGADGQWASSDNPIEREPFSEPAVKDSKRSVLVGMKFSLNGATQILRFSQDYFDVHRNGDKNKKEKSK